jgi:hypothetical protein
MNKTIYFLISMIASFALTLGNYSSAIASPAAVAKSVSVVIGGVSTPCSTLDQCSGLLVPGATMYVSGEWDETLTVSAMGTSAQPINVIGTSAVILATTSNGIWIAGDYINLSGFEVSGAKSFGIAVTGKHIIIENNIVHHAVTGNGINGSCGSGSHGSALKLSLGAEDVIVRGNTVHENCGEGIAVTRGVNVLIENNTVWDNFVVNIYVDNSPYVVVQNNTSTCTGSYMRSGRRPNGVSLGEESYSGWGAQRHDINILNNVIDGCDYGILAWESYVGGTMKNVLISGNTIKSGITRSISLYTLNQNVRVENNLIYADLYVKNMDGVTLLNNTIIGETSTIFADVPASYWAITYIESLYNAGITGGCSASPLMYCPASPVTRAQMAIFILRGIHGSAYTPPAATGTVFSDVPASAFGAAWIEQFALEGITSGCGSGKYCPDANVTRAQMAIFLLKGTHGSSYVPPSASGVFSDVPVDSFAADWIEQLAAEGITSGCGGGNYCPNANVTRDQMAVFLVKAFNLP